MLTRDYKVSLYKDLQDPKFAIEYLNAALEDSYDVFLLSLKDVADARGGLTKLSGKSKLSREAIYRMLSKNGNPELNSISKILSCLGLRFTVKKNLPSHC